MVPWVVNLALISVLLYLLFQRRKQRWPAIARQGLAFENPVSVLAALRTDKPGTDEPGADVAGTGGPGTWAQGTLTYGDGGYHWTPGASVTAQRLAPFTVEHVRLAGIAEGIWSLQLDWLVLRCTGPDGSFDLATSRAALRGFPDLARYAEDDARSD